jgi:hypothetical protein
MAKFFGWLLIIIGVLIAGTAGLCSAAMLTPGSGMKPSDWIGTVAIIGGIPFVFGVACIIAGWVIRKPKPK